MKTRLYICIIERGKYVNYACIENRHCILVPTPISGITDESPFTWWRET